MRQSEAINELAAALSKAQAKIEGAVKAAVNPQFKAAGRDGKYADLSSVWEAIREPLTSNGLAVVQLLRGVERGVECETILMHTTGQHIAETLFVPVSKNDAQGYGSAATYARRFSLMAMVGVAPVDDDGNAAVEAKPAGQSFERGKPLAEARREMDAGTASTAKPAPKAETATDWANGDEAKAWLARAKVEVNAINNPADLGRWQDANASTLDTLDAKSPKRHAWIMDVINTRLDAVSNLRAAG